MRFWYRFGSCQFSAIFRDQEMRLQNPGNIRESRDHQKGWISSPFCRSHHTKMDNCTRQWFHWAMFSIHIKYKSHILISGQLEIRFSTKVFGRLQKPSPWIESRLPSIPFQLEISKLKRFSLWLTRRNGCSYPQIIWQSMSVQMETRGKIM